MGSENKDNIRGMVCTLDLLVAAITSSRDYGIVVKIKRSNGVSSQNLGTITRNSVRLELVYTYNETIYSRPALRSSPGTRTAVRR